MNKILKQEMGSTVILGLQGNETFINGWTTGFHNYSISDSPHSLCDNFRYFLSSKKKILAGLQMYFYHKFFLEKKCPAGQYWIYARQEAKKTYEGLEDSRFYSDLLHENNKNITEDYE